MSYLFRNKFKEKIEAGKFVISCEINPDKKGDLKKNFQEISLFAPFVDVIDVTDSALAHARPSSFVMASIIQKKYDIATLFNYSCRDRNIIGMKSDLYGALILGLQNILAMTGDRPSMGDHPDAKPVFEFSSIGLLKLLSEIHTPDLSFFPGAVLNFFDDANATEMLFKRKKEAGAKYIVTQPVYTREKVDFLKTLQDKYNLPILASIMPIQSKKTLIYVQNKIPGITVPHDEYVRMLDMNDEELFVFQIRTAADLFQYIKAQQLAGVHFLPLGRGDKIPEIIRYSL